jgi:tetratricopeptide (TPR) repeat protein
MEPGSIVAERFEIEALAGKGGMGSVYRARDCATGETVALKLLQHEAAHAKRLLREAELLSELVHPNIVRYVAHGTSAGFGSYIAMEWLEGVSLRERLLEGRLSVNETLAVGEQTALALGRAHARSVVHRDVKPENLFLLSGSPDALRVLDFGVALAKRLGPRMTKTGVPMGTIGYMSPEQARGETDVDSRADVFALGEVLFECLTGRPAFYATHPLAVLAKIIFEDAPRASELEPATPRAVDLLVSQMLTKERELRPKDGTEVAARIHQIRANLGVAAVAPSQPAASSLNRIAPALTKSERRSMSVVLGAAAGGSLDITLPLDAFEARTVVLRQIAEQHGGRVDTLGSADFLAVFAGRDFATRAARAALAIRAALRDTRIAMATGNAVMTENLPVGEVVDRAAAFLEDDIGESVRVDAASAGLLPTRFELWTDEHGHIALVRERESAPARRLLGKPMPCIGRERELETLSAIVDECIDEPVTRAVLITGSEGVGKSRIRHELTEQLKSRERAVAVWVGRGDSTLAGAPFALAASLLGDILADGIEARVQAHVPATDQRRVAEFLAELGGIPFSDSNSVQLRAARRDPILMRDQVQRAFEDFIEAECRAHPLLIVLEDLQWGDLPSVRLLDGVLRRVCELPLLVLGVARPEVHDAFPNLWSERALLAVRVHELGKRASTELVKRALGDAIQTSEIETLVERAGGNALFLEELVRAHAEGRTELPGSVLAMVQARLEALPPEARRTLRAASVFGRSLPSKGLTPLLAGVEPDEVNRTIEALVTREFLVRRERSLAFRNALVRDAAYSSLTESDRTLGHRLAGEWLAARGDEKPVILAEHFEKGGLPARAVPWWSRAARDALDANDFARAIDWAESGRRAGATGAELGELGLTRAEALRWTGKLTEAATELDDALLALAPGSAEFCHAAAERALVLQRLGRCEELGELGRRLLAQSVRTTADNALAYALVRTGLFLLLVGQRALAFSLVRVVEELADPEAHLEPPTFAQLHVFRAVDALQRSDLASYLAEEEAAKRRFDEVGDLRRSLNEAGSIGYAYLELGAHPEAERVLSETLALASRMGLTHVVAASQHNLGLVYSRKGDFSRARDAEQRAVTIFRAQEDRRLEGAALAYLAEIELGAGNENEAIALAEQSLTLLREVAPLIVPYPAAILARAWLGRDRASDALELLEPIVLQLDTVGTAEAGDALVRLTHAETLVRMGQTERARKALTQARVRLTERADRIADPTLRQSFLENVPENARTLALCRELEA